MDLPNSVGPAGAPHGEDQQLVQILDKPDEQEALHHIIVVVDDGVLEEGVVHLEGFPHEPGVGDQHRVEAVPEDDLVLATVDQVGLKVDHPFVLELREVEPLPHENGDAARSG